MPVDGTGKFRHNDEVAQFHSKAAGKPMQGEKEQSEHVEIHPHGDGTFHTIHKGEQVEHETHGHALMHAAKVHAGEGESHFHAHHDGMSMHTHSMKGGEPEHEEHDPKNLENMKNSFNKFVGEEENEGSHPEPDGDEGEGMSGMY